MYCGRLAIGYRPRLYTPYLSVKEDIEVQVFRPKEYITLYYGPQLKSV